MKPDCKNIEEYAAQWILRCDRGEDILEARADFEAWLAADARHRAAFLRLESAWQRSEGLKAWRQHDGAVDARVLAWRKATVRTGSRAMRRVSFALAAALVLVLLGATSWLFTDSTRTHRYVTDTGGYQRVVLADGSLVQLNTDSRVAVQFSADRREVRLERGEAYFDIARDPNRPFEVLAADAVVRAIGTAFSVRLHNGEQVEVLVKDGQVALSSSSPPPAGRGGGRSEGPSSLSLSAGESALSKPTGLAINKLPEPELKRRLAWQTGQLAFQGDTLAFVIAEFNRYNRRQIRIADPALGQLEVAGNFKATDLDSLIAAIRRALDVRVEERQGEIYLFVRSRSAL